MILSALFSMEISIPHCSNIVEWYDAVLFGKRYDPIVGADNRPRTALVGFVIFSKPKRPDIIQIGVALFLDFNRMQLPIKIDDKINFIVALIPVKIQIGFRINSGIIETFQDFAKHKCFKKRAAHGSRFNLLRRVPLGQKRHQARIQEKYLRGFNGSLRDIAVIRGQKINQIGSTEYRKPTLTDGTAYADILGNTLHI